MTALNNQDAAMTAIPHQRSWALNAQAEKVLASTESRDISGQSRLSVQPAIFKVRRLEPAWILAPSNRPTSHTDTRTHIRDARTCTRRGNCMLAPSGKHQKQVRQVRRLDRPSNHAGSRRPTYATNHFEVGRI